MAPTPHTLSAEAAHLLVVGEQRPLLQSALAAHVAPSHLAHVTPPQSIPLSSPLVTPSVHVGAVHLPLMQVRFAQSSFCAQARPTSHFCVVVSQAGTTMPDEDEPPPGSPLTVPAAPDEPPFPPDELPLEELQAAASSDPNTRQTRTAAIDARISPPKGKTTYVLFRVRVAGTRLKV